MEKIRAKLKNTYYLQQEKYMAWKLKWGRDVTEQQARLAAGDTVFIILSIIKKYTGDIDKFITEVNLQGFVRASLDLETNPL